MPLKYTCHYFEDRGWMRGEIHPNHLETDSVEELAAHRIEALNDEIEDPRGHMLDIVNTDNEGRFVREEGMCLMDAVIDIEENSVKWFLDESFREGKGRRL